MAFFLKLSRLIFCMHFIIFGMRPVHQFLPDLATKNSGVIECMYSWLFHCLCRSQISTYGTLIVPVFIKYTGKNNVSNKSKTPPPLWGRNLVKGASRWYFCSARWYRTCLAQCRPGVGGGVTSLARADPPRWPLHSWRQVHLLPTKDGTPASLTPSYPPKLYHKTTQTLALQCTVAEIIT